MGRLPSSPPLTRQILRQGGTPDTGAVQRAGMAGRARPTGPSGDPLLGSGRLPALSRAGAGTRPAVRGGRPTERLERAGPARTPPPRPPPPRPRPPHGLARLPWPAP